MRGGFPLNRISLSIFCIFALSSYILKTTKEEAKKAQEEKNEAEQKTKDAKTALANAESKITEKQSEIDRLKNRIDIEQVVLEGLQSEVEEKRREKDSINTSDEWMNPRGRSHQRSHRTVRQGSLQVLHSLPCPSGPL